MTFPSDTAQQDIEFLSHFSELPDPRQLSKVLYPLNEVLLLSLCAVLSGADSFVEIAAYGVKKRDFLRRFSPFANGTPSHDQLGNIFAALDPQAFQRCFIAWVSALQADLNGVVAIDGKTLRRSRSTAAGSRSRVTTASLARLTAPGTGREEFGAHARFAIGTLPALTARPGQIKALRQTILNLAVRGKLVEQDPADEPAAELLKRIAVEKARLVKEGFAEKSKALPKVSEDDAPFNLPDGWAWGRFPELGVFGRGKSKHRPRNDPALFEGGSHLMIQTGDVARSQGVITTFTNKYNDTGLAQSMQWPKGTMCITIAANIADSGILDFDACFPDSVVGFRPAMVFDNARYFEYFVRTAKANLLEFAPATAQKNINIEILTSVLIPLPPLAEQRRIVAKADELMTLCDQLEDTVATADTTRHRFLEALLHEALVPTETALEVTE